jgi:histone H3/H4
MLNLEWHYGERRLAFRSLAAADFPARRSFADLDRMRACLAAALAGRRTVTRCDIANVWYIPGKRFQVVYRHGEGLTDLVTAEFAGAGQGRARLAAAIATGADPVRVVFLGDDWDGVAWLFPADPLSLPMGPLLGGEAGARRAARMAGEAPGNVEPQRRLLSYLPGERCALRYAWAGCDVSVVGKLQRGVAASHDFMQALWRLPGRRFRMARPLACDEAHGLRWEQFSAGRRIEDGHDVHEDLPAVAAGLARLHAAPVPRLPRSSAAEVLARIERKVLPRIVAALPGLAGESEALLVALARQAQTLAARPALTLHGDLHTGNVLLDRGEAVFIDLDSLILGEPAYDLALIATRLLLRGLIEDGQVGAPGRAAAQLPALYAQAGGAGIPDAVYAWYVAALLLGRQVKTCVRHHAPEMERLAATLLAWAAELIRVRRFDPALFAAV